MSPSVPTDLVENRSLALKPLFNVAKLDPYPALYENYINDQFPFRKEILKSFNRFNYYALRRSPVPEKAIIGKDGWLFLADRQLSTFLGTKMFTEDELKNVENEFFKRKKFCDSCGIKFYFFIIPQRHTIYKELIPAKYRKVNQQGVKNQLIEYFNKKGRVKIFDLEETMLQGKNKYGKIYRKYDNHWNDLGAFLGFQHICEEIKKDFPQLKIPDIEDYIIDTVPEKNGGIANMLGLYDDLIEDEIKLFPKFESLVVDGVKKNYPIPEGFPYGDVYEVVKYNSNGVDIKVLIIRESFADIQTKFIQETFKNSILLFESWDYNFREEIINQEKPDIVIIQTVECFIPNLVNSQ